MTRILLLLFALCSVGWFAESNARHYALLLDNIALNAAAATRTATIQLDRRWSKVRWYVAFTYAAATTVTAACERSPDGTIWYRVTSRKVIDDVLNADESTGELRELTDSHTTTAESVNYSFEFLVDGDKSVRCLFGGASGGASDLVDVDAVVAVGR